MSLTVLPLLGRSFWLLVPNIAEGALSYHHSTGRPFAQPEVFHLSVVTQVPSDWSHRLGCEALSLVDQHACVTTQRLAQETYRLIIDVRQFATAAGCEPCAWDNLGTLSSNRALLPQPRSNRLPVRLRSCFRTGLETPTRLD